jgi:hypothetical protein
MEIKTNRTTSTSVLGRITGLLMIALLVAPGVSHAQQASSPDSVIIQMSLTGEVVKVTKPDGTPIPRVKNSYERLRRGGKGRKQFVFARCKFCDPDGCYCICGPCP